MLSQLIMNQLVLYIVIIISVVLHTVTVNQMVLYKMVICTVIMNQKVICTVIIMKYMNNEMKVVSLVQQRTQLINRLLLWQQLDQDQCLQLTLLPLSQV